MSKNNKFKKIDHTGQRFGKLVVIEQAGKTKQGYYRWRCKCDCGNEIVCSGAHLRSGRTRSCGHCYRLEYEQIEGHVKCTANTTGSFFLFDVEDYDRVVGYNWRMSEYGYVSCWKDNEVVKLHRLLLDAPVNLFVDHINGCPNDCRKDNLRLVTPHENAFNTRLYKNNKTGYKGVFWHERMRRFQASIRFSGKHIHLGFYDSPLDAAHAYNNAASTYFGEYA
ncbi:hypothetical protein FACS1894184_12630 [Clostridia bacterium]|nr:hypothetical protein FACS1894184_12630 [Clostridia bacterium]